MSEGKAKERAEIPEPDAVAAAGIRYEAVPWGKARGLEQNGGYIAAIEEATNLEKWILKVYSVAYDDGKEQDKQDVFITRMQWEKKHVLRVEDERGRQYLVDVIKRSVAEMGN